jgi:anaerobic selenocysteine-containing dehydrogenase
LDVADPLVPYANGGFAGGDGRAVLAFDEDNGFGRLPEFVPPPVDRFPLILMTPKHHMRFLNTSYSHLPRHADPEGSPFLAITPADAEARGISDGDLVTVFNDRAELAVRATISDLVASGVVAVPFGWWDRSHPARTSVNELTTDELTDHGGGVGYSDTRVEVSVV